MTLLVTRRSKIPGSRFNPSEQELIHILDRKTNNRGKNCSFITEMDVYEKEPWLLQHVRHFRSVKNKWFYFTTMKKAPGIKKENSKRTSRTVARGLTWKGNTTTPITDKNGVTIGYDKSLTFLAKDKAKFLARDKATGWVMHEFTLSKAEFQEMVLCRIRFNPDKENAQYAPSLEPIVIGQPKPPREDGLTLLSNQTHLYVPADDAPIETHYQGVEPQQQHQLWNGSFPNEVVSYPTGQPQHLMNGGMDQYQDFGSFGQFVGAQPYYQNMLQGMPENQDFGSYPQYWGGDLTQNHLPSVPIETHQGVEQQQKLWTGSCPSEAFSYSTAQHQQLMNGGMKKYKDFGSYAQYWEGYLAQNNLPSVPIDTHQDLEHQQKLWTGSCPSEVVSYPTGQYQQLMNEGIEQYQNFGSFGQFVGAQPYYQNMLQCMPENQDFGSYAQYWGGDLTQTHHSVISMDTQKGIEPQKHDNSCFVDNVVENQTTEQQQQYLRQHSNLSVTHQKMMEQQEFFSSTKFSGGDFTQNHISVVPMETKKSIEPQKHDNSLAHQRLEHQESGSSTQFSGGDLTQNHLSMVTMATQKDIELQQKDNSCLGHNVVENQTTEPPNLTQEQNQPLGELDEIDEFMNMEWPLEIEDMANFGNEDWRKQLGENTPEEEAELKAELEKCNTIASLLNYVCQSH